MTAAQPELPLKVVPGEREDRRTLAAKVYERHGIALKEDDPAFALVTLNELMLRKLLRELLKEVDRHITARLAEFDQTMERVEQRASKILAHQVRETAATMQGSTQDEIASTRLGVQRMLEQVRNAYRIATLARWCTVAAVVVLAVFACGFWVGRF